MFVFLFVHLAKVETSDEKEKLYFGFLLSNYIKRQNN